MEVLEQVWGLPASPSEDCTGGNSRTGVGAASTSPAEEPVEVPEQVWEWKYQKRCGGGSTRKGVGVEVPEKVWEWKYQNRYGSESTRTGVRMEVPEQVWGWKYQNRCGGGSTRTGVGVEVPEQV